MLRPAYSSLYRMSRNSFRQQSIPKYFRFRSFYILKNDKQLTSFVSKLIGWHCFLQKMTVRKGGEGQNLWAYALIEKLGLTQNVQYRLCFFSPNLESVLKSEWSSLIVFFSWGVSLASLAVTHATDTLFSYDLELRFTESGTIFSIVLDCGSISWKLLFFDKAGFTVVGSSLMLLTINCS